VPLDRQRIARKDFPIGRRGYDPEQVDAHLAALADEVEGLRRSSPRGPETLAANASEHVRAIVEAAETSAAEIQRHAAQEAQAIRGEASAEAKAARGQARNEAREYVAKVAQVTAAMLERLEVVQNEVTGLIESLRASGSRLSAGLQTLERELEALSGSDPGGAPQPVAGAPELREAEPLEDEVQVQETSEKVHGDALAGDLDDARLVALNMALNGSSREDTERHLAENFKLRDRRRLVDEVYASVEG
jgi:DivIVA domain-containing protein